MRLPVAVKVGAFALVVMGSYTYYANSIPQIQSKPPAELSLAGGNVTTAQLVKAGEEIFPPKGTCVIRHALRKKGALPPSGLIECEISHGPLVGKISCPAFTSWAVVTLPPSSEGSAGGFDWICGIEFA